MTQVTEINPTNAHKMISNGEAILIDVREHIEITQNSIDDAIHVPMSAFDPSLIPVESGKKFIFLCTHGIRSFQVSQYLISKGIIDDAYNLSGGLAAWIEAGLPTRSNP